MKKSLEDIFSENNLLDYGRACVDVASDMAIRDIDTLLIPSRGAFPIFLGAVSALKYIGREYEEYDMCYQRLNPAIPINGWLEEYLPKSERSVDLPKLSILFAPFTADLNIRKEGVDDLKITELVRDYWSKVTASFFLPENERKENPYFKSFTEVILRFIEGRQDLAEKYESFPKSEKIGLIDTVISGRASSTILNCFDGLEVRPYSMLVVDSDGSKLKTPFKQSLEKRKYDNTANLISTKRIVSEDEGAALEGVIALVYPSVMIRSLDLRYNHRDFFFGAGSWHYPSLTEEEYSRNFQLFMSTIRDAVALNTIGKYCEKTLWEEPEKEFVEYRKKFLENMNKYNFLRRKDESVDIFNLNSSLRVRQPYETGSHVLHVPFDETSTKAVIRELISKVPGVAYNH